MDNEKVERLECQIKDAAYRAANIVESYLVDGLLSKLASYAVESFNQAIEEVIEEIHSIKQEVMKVEDEIGVHDLQPRTSLGAVSSNPTLSGMVGLDDELEEIKTRLISGSSKLQILSILGMRGFGSMKMLPDNMRNEDKIDKLKGLLHKTLSRTRYLIVLDDVWDKNAWDDAKRLFSNDNNGSRIILPTRCLAMRVIALLNWMKLGRKFPKIVEGFHSRLL
ncbi:late blight resistance homolog R1A-10 [Olea europaea subsp. europaea]|uniref:Late blight resistance homolog R1A-10 n=1 Tax=Olea europaea subsp. europaea TaxID=158383 RepID=A0A8S0PWF3_OLEEU|nr:late blight resistance homolog R1A-10 [Olea europaea subsp. europaea]